MSRHGGSWESGPGTVVKAAVDPAPVMTLFLVSGAAEFGASVSAAAECSVACASVLAFTFGVGWSATQLLTWRAHRASLRLPALDCDRASAGNGRIRLD